MVSLGSYTCTFSRSHIYLSFKLPSLCKWLGLALFTGYERLRQVNWISDSFIRFCEHLPLVNTYRGLQTGLSRTYLRRSDCRWNYRENFLSSSYPLDLRCQLLSRSLNGSRLSCATNVGISSLSCDDKDAGSISVRAQVKAISSMNSNTSLSNRRRTSKHPRTWLQQSARSSNKSKTLCRLKGHVKGDNGPENGQGTILFKYKVLLFNMIWARWYPRPRHRRPHTWGAGTSLATSAGHRQVQASHDFKPCVNIDQGTRTYGLQLVCSATNLNTSPSTTRQNPNEHALERIHSVLPERVLELLLPKVPIYFCD